MSAASNDPSSRTSSATRDAWEIDLFQDAIGASVVDEHKRQLVEVARQLPPDNPGANGPSADDPSVDDQDQARCATPLLQAAALLLGLQWLIFDKPEVPLQDALCEATRFAVDAMRHGHHPGTPQQDRGRRFDVFHVALLDQKRLIFLPDGLPDTNSEAEEAAAIRAIFEAQLGASAGRGTGEDAVTHEHREEGGAAQLQGLTALRSTLAHLVPDKGHLPNDRASLAIFEAAALLLGLESLALHGSRTSVKLAILRAHHFGMELSLAWHEQGVRPEVALRLLQRESAAVEGGDLKLVRDEAPPH